MIYENVYMFNKLLIRVIFILYFDMDLNNLGEKNITPKSVKNVVGKLFKNTAIRNNPLTNFSTPPRFTRIRNPFESHIIERLHLPTFSPSVFAQISTPKTEDTFKWPIDHLAHHNPADIDETTIDHQVIDHDPSVEFLVQSRIDQFFKEDVIVPSPMVPQSENQVPSLLSHISSTSNSSRTYSEGTCGFNSFNGCLKCTCSGEYDKKGRHMSFPSIDSPLRTDSSFRNKLDEDHHKIDSPLLNLPINMVEDFIIADSLHLLDLGSAQTVLTLPPVLPPELEELLKPYFTYTTDQQYEIKTDTSLARKLFEFEMQPSNQADSEMTSPVLDRFSPVHTSPLVLPGQCSDVLQRTFLSPNQESRNLSELRECNLSPIGSQSPEMSISPKHSSSACRLSFSRFDDCHMSIDASIRVPDISHQISCDQSTIDCGQNTNSSQPNFSSDSIVNWDVEYNQVSLITTDDSDNGSRMDISNSNTPHSRIFIGQRKRLSDSFKNDEIGDSALNSTQDLDNDNMTATTNRRIKNRLFKEDYINNTDAGYHTEGKTLYEDSSSAWNLNTSHSLLFASTPTKKMVK